jgi:hypothetical protein
VSFIQHKFSGQHFAGFGGDEYHDDLMGEGGCIDAEPLVVDVSFFEQRPAVEVKV